MWCSRYRTRGRQAGKPAQCRTDHNGNQASRQTAAEAHSAEVTDQHNDQRGDADQRMRVCAIQESECDECQRDARERAQQGCARRDAADAIC